MNRAFLFEKIMTASEQLDREPSPPAPPQTLEGFVKEAGYALRGACSPRDIDATWLERFGGTPLFESAKALAQQSLQRESEEASREAQLQDFKKQIGLQDWDARRAAEEQIALQKSMLELELADLRNQEQMAAMQTTPAGGTPVPTLGELAAEPAAPKTASDKLAGPLDAIKGLNWSGLQRSAGNIARSSIAPAAVGAGLGAVGGAVTAGPGESALGGAAKGALGGAAIGGIGHAAARSGQALGVGKLLKPKTQAMSAARGPATVAAAPAHAADPLALGPTQLSPQMPSPASAGPAALRAGGTPPSIPSLQTPARGTPPSIPSLQVPVKGGATLPPGADGKLPTIYNPYVS